MKHLLFSVVLFSLVVAFTTNAATGQENWPAWRGAQADGVASGANYPVKWSTDQNVVWKYKLPGLGASTPAIWGDLIFLTGESSGNNSVLCLNRAGEKQWETKLGKETPARNRKASGANSSPTTDGTHVFVYFKSGQLAALDFDGKLVWEKNLQDEYGEDTLWWDLGTSPVLTAQHVVVACMQTGGSYLAAFEKLSGKEAWKVERTVDAPGESAQSYTTPLVLGDGAKETIVILGADHVTAHSAENGQQLWMVGGLNPDRRGNWRSIASPVYADGMVIAPYARGRSLTAIRVGGSGDVTDSHVVWATDGPAADVPTPAVHDGRLYVTTDRGRVAVIDVTDGSVVAEEQLPGRVTLSASPVLAGDHIYVTSEAGTVYVLKAQDLELVSENKLEDFAVATPIFSGGRAYVRTDAYLWCFAE